MGLRFAEMNSLFLRSSGSCGCRTGIILSFSLILFTGSGAANKAKDSETGAKTAEKNATAQIAQAKARITALEAELTNAKKSNEEAQKQLTEPSKKLKVLL